MCQNWLRSGFVRWGAFLPYAAELALLSVLWASEGSNFHTL